MKYKGHVITEKKSYIIFKGDQYVGTKSTMRSAKEVALKSEIEELRKVNFLLKESK